MFKYNNTHIFTGYLKQLLASVNLPACKIYTNEFAKYFALHGKEDPRVLESFNTIPADTINKYAAKAAVRVNYLKNNELCYYFSDNPSIEKTGARWIANPDLFYSSDKHIAGFTRTLNSPGTSYDAVTHEYLGDYLRFLRDYHNINLMSMYNCFNDKIYNNVYFNKTLNGTKVVFNSQDLSYKIYAIPVKLFSEYTIAIDCSQGLEMFCGLYNTALEESSCAINLAAKTYEKVNSALFNRPFLYTKLNIKNWPAAEDFKVDNTTGKQTVKRNKGTNEDTFTRWDLINREKDLRLFIKVPTYCKSSIVILEGDYRGFNDFKYSVQELQTSTPATKGSENIITATPVTLWTYQQNHCVLNFSSNKSDSDIHDLNDYTFKPISKLQLLAFNTGESYPFADRLVEYLIGSAITSIDDIPDNIIRTQRVIEQNKTYFKTEGLWENKIQNILYDYMVNSGPVKLINGKLTDTRRGLQPALGHRHKSTMYDVLGYVDKDAEKLYASWKAENNRATANTNIQNIDIYNGLYDI